MAASKVALVTGAGGGIGRATSIAFAQNGYRVVVSDLKVEGGNATVDQIKVAGGEASFCKADVSKEEDVIALLNFVKDTYSRLDAAYNNAGVDGEQSDIANCSTDNWNFVVGVNLTGVFFCCREEIKLMKETAEKGTIVNCSSVLGKIGNAVLCPYAASKHGVLGLTKSIAVDMASKGIRCNAICPGVIYTEMVQHVQELGLDIEGLVKARMPIGRAGNPEEVAETVVWLCSDAASLVNGAALNVDGAWLAG